MQIKVVDKEGKRLVVDIPLTKGLDKSRVKSRRDIWSFGDLVATRTDNITPDCYIEWMISYEVQVESDKLERTSMPKEIFIGGNGVLKAFYELSEYIKYFFDWGLVPRSRLESIKLNLSKLTPEDFLDSGSFPITRQSPKSTTVHGFDFSSSHVMHPLLLRDFGSGFIAEIIIQEKQFARGTQPMFYLCFPVLNLDNGSEIIGRIAKLKEFAQFTIDSGNINMFVEILAMFGVLSKSHNRDVLIIIDKILK